MKGSALVLASLLVLLSGASTMGAPPGPPATRAFTLEAVALMCPVPTATPDGVCLAYNGEIPGPTLDVNLGDTVVLTLINRIPQTVANLSVPQAVKDHLAQASVSFHVHGTALGSDVDGIAAHVGTDFIPSYAPPGGAFTYTFRAAFRGTWHFHDHVLGADGSEGTLRGLYGALVVRSGGEARADHVLDLHLLGNGANAGQGLDATVAAGESFELAVAVLGSDVWAVTLNDPDGGLVGALRQGPGESERLRVDAALPGTYTWSATWGPETFEGTVVVS